jgi:hypothetical protein
MHSGGTAASAVLRMWFIFDLARISRRRCAAGVDQVGNLL